VTLKRRAVNTTSKLDLTRTQAHHNRRAHQVLETRPMTLDEAPATSRSNASPRSVQVLQTQRTSMQRSLF
jgi:hypothetical protein